MRDLSATPGCSHQDNLILALDDQTWGHLQTNFSRSLVGTWVIAVIRLESKRCNGPGGSTRQVHHRRCALYGLAGNMRHPSIGVDGPELGSTCSKVGEGRGTIGRRKLTAHITVNDNIEDAPVLRLAA